MWVLHQNTARKYSVRGTVGQFTAGQSAPPLCEIYLLSLNTAGQKYSTRCRISAKLCVALDQKDSWRQGWKVTFQTEHCNVFFCFLFFPIADWFHKRDLEPSQNAFMGRKCKRWTRDLHELKCDLNFEGVSRSASSGAGKIPQN